MIRHTLFLRFNAGTAPPDRDAGLLSLIVLCDRVGEVTSFACGPDVDPRSQADGFTHAFTILLGSEAARDALRALPDYADALGRISQTAEVKQVAD